MEATEGHETRLRAPQFTVTIGRHSTIRGLSGAFIKKGGDIADTVEWLMRESHMQLAPQEERCSIVAPSLDALGCTPDASIQEITCAGMKYQLAPAPAEALVMLRIAHFAGHQGQMLNRLCIGTHPPFSPHEHPIVLSAQYKHSLVLDRYMDQPHKPFPEDARFIFLRRESREHAVFPDQD